MSGSDDFNVYMWKIPDQPAKGTGTTIQQFCSGGHQHPFLFVHM